MTDRRRYLPDVPEVPEPETREQAEDILESASREQEELRQAPPVTVTPEAISDYLQGEAKELAKVEAYVCAECLYAAGVHSDDCSRFAQVVG